MSGAGKAGSGADTDEEDLGLPASIQNSPGDYTGRALTSRHHSSCSDNSLLSLDSGGLDTPLGGVTDSGAESLGLDTGAEAQQPVSSPAGQLSHQAARHKLAVRPRRNHAATRHRRLQQLAEVRPDTAPVLTPHLVSSVYLVSVYVSCIYSREARTTSLLVFGRLIRSKLPCHYSHIHTRHKFKFNCM